jgi:diguanylate cyclase (GGDEF)-like protein
VLALAQGGEQVWLEMRFGPLPGGGGALGIVRSIEDRRALEDRLFVAAMTDPLTGLTNRDAFQRMLAHLVDSGQAGHVALFDLDHFRGLNLRHGHSGGDRVLVAFAGLLRSLLRVDDILSRVGGGTFGVLLPDAGRAAAAAACERVVAAIAELAEGGRRLSLSASAGLAGFGNSADATLRNAELALIAAKAAGRSRVAFAGGDDGHDGEPRWRRAAGCH